jgi:hypothetical protein
MKARSHSSLYRHAPDSLHPFEMPIYLPPPERGELRTLLDTAHYVLKLPPDIFAKSLWREAAQAVVGAARSELSLDIVWIAICRALLASYIEGSSTPNDASGFSEVNNKRKSLSR